MWLNDTNKGNTVLLKHDRPFYIVHLPSSPNYNSWDPTPIKTLYLSTSLSPSSPRRNSLSLSRTESWLSRRSRSPTPSSRWTVRYLSLSPSLEHLVCFICYHLFDLRAPGNQIKIWSFFSRSLDFESLSFRSEKKKLSFRGNESDYFFRFEKIPIFSYLEKASGLLSDSWDTQ